jgi:hypothetical protein
VETVSRETIVKCDHCQGQDHGHASFVVEPVTVSIGADHDSGNSPLFVTGDLCRQCYAALIGNVRMQFKPADASLHDIISAHAVEANPELQ